MYIISLGLSNGQRDLLRAEMAALHASVTGLSARQTPFLPLSFPHAVVTSNITHMSHVPLLFPMCTLALEARWSDRPEQLNRPAELQGKTWVDSMNSPASATVTSLTGSASHANS